jgi:hypothetical protein
MTIRNVMVAVLFVAIAVTAVNAKIHRDQSAVAAFKRENPCPATSARRGSCKGYVIDHIAPLCAGGEDHPRNMQWKTKAQAKLKDRDEIRLCAQYRKAAKLVAAK